MADISQFDKGKVSVGGVTFFGRPLGLASAAQIEKLDIGARAQLHFSRRFRDVSQEFMESLVGKEIEEFDKFGEPTGNTITLTPEIINAELGRDPFGFSPGVIGFSDPHEALLTIKAHALELASEGKLEWMGGASSSGRIAKCYMEIDLNYPVGHETFLPLHELQIGDQEKATSNMRGVNWPHEGEELYVDRKVFAMPTLVVLDPVLTQKVSVVLSAQPSENGRLTDTVGVISAWPGRMQPSYPGLHMTQENMNESIKFFAVHARLVLQGVIDRTP